MRPGVNHISRRSSESALTVDQDAVYARQRCGRSIRRVNQCRCGWPQSLLLPRGSPLGTRYRLLAVLSDLSRDQVRTQCSALS